jgi:hypothetical protein
MTTRTEGATLVQISRRLHPLEAAAVARLQAESSPSSLGSSPSFALDAEYLGILANDTSHERV